MIKKWICFLFSTFCLVFPVATLSLPGDLDPAFSSDGKLTTAIYSNSLGQSVKQQQDGKLVFAGSGVLVRCNSDGSLDTTFSGDGIQGTPVYNGSGGGGDVGYSVIQQGNGKLVVAGTTLSGGYADIALARYNSDGSLDMTFSGDGLQTTAVGMQNDRVYSVIQQVDGKLVVAGEIDYKFALVRYNSDGSLDAAFLTTISGAAKSVIQQKDGKLVAAGYSYSGGGSDFVLVRFNSNGSLDTTFSGDGIQTQNIGGSSASDSGESVIQQSDGKLVMAGYYSDASVNAGYSVLLRYNSDGSLDKSILTVGSPYDGTYSVIQQKDGKLVTAGYSRNGANYDFSLVRYNSNGTLDTTFSDDGKLTLDETSSDKAYSIIQQSDGKLVVAGSSGTNFLLARFESGDQTISPDYIAPTVPSGLSATTVSPTQINLSWGASTDAVGVAAYKIYRGGILLTTQGNVTSYNDTGLSPSTSYSYTVAACDVKGNCSAKSASASATTQQDSDGDGVTDSSDNCPVISNVLQTNTDGDGMGDACDTDDDNDGKLDGVDNCPLISNASQTDTDGDSTGNACDADDDNDGVADVSDAFPLNASASVDADVDGKPDSCTGSCTGGLVLDSDDDNDGVADSLDAFPLNASASVDTDGDGKPDSCIGSCTGGLVLDSDDDNDGVADTSDNCPLISNVSQTNTDGDSMGDACDADDDGDGVTDITDNCPLISNTTQTNTDGDSEGNSCDTDDDNDSVADVSDNCPAVANTNQLDWDSDGLGDKCDDPVPLPDDIAGDVVGDRAGVSVAFAGDFNGDGYGDYVVGIPGFDVSTKIKDAGRAEVISGKDGSVLASIEGTAAKDAMGFAVAGGADIDGDGFDDVVIGAPNAGSTHTGTVTVIYGRADNANRNPVTINGTATKSQFGAAVALGNVDGVAGAEVLVGAPKEASASGIKQAGSVRMYSYSGNSLAPLGTPFYGVAPKALAGTSVAAGDVNNDGMADIVIGAPGDSDTAIKGSGSVTVYGAAGTVLMQKYGTSIKAQFGKAVAVGDVNNDSYDDVLVGAPLDDDLASNKKDTGSVTVFSVISNTQLTKKYGSNTKAQLGYSVAAGDVNGDNKADIIAGAWKDNKPTANPKKPIKMAGSVAVFSGNGYAQIGTTKYGNVAKDYFGAAVGAGDINSDGKADIIIGIPGFDLPVTVNGKTKLQKDAGKVTVVNGAEF